MSDLLTALGLVLIIEGITLALLADRLDALVELLAEIPPGVLRAAGVISAALGLFLVWVLRA